MEWCRKFLNSTYIPKTFTATPVSLSVLYVAEKQILRVHVMWEGFHPNTSGFLSLADVVYCISNPFVASQLKCWRAFGQRWAESRDKCHTCRASWCNIKSCWERTLGRWFSSSGWLTFFFRISSHDSRQICVEELHRTWEWRHPHFQQVWQRAKKLRKLSQPRKREADTNEDATLAPHCDATEQAPTPWQPSVPCFGCRAVLVLWPPFGVGHRECCSVVVCCSLLCCPLVVKNWDDGVNCHMSVAKEWLAIRHDVKSSSVVDRNRKVGEGAAFRDHGNGAGTLRAATTASGRKVRMYLFFLLCLCLLFVNVVCVFPVFVCVDMCLSFVFRAFLSRIYILHFFASFCLFASDGGRSRAFRAESCELCSVKFKRLIVNRTRTMEGLCRRGRFWQEAGASWAPWSFVWTCRSAQKLSKEARHKMRVSLSTVRSWSVCPNAPIFCASQLRMHVLDTKISINIFFGAKVRGRWWWFFSRSQRTVPSTTVSQIAACVLTEFERNRTYVFSNVKGASFFVRERSSNVLNGFLSSTWAAMIRIVLLIGTCNVCSGDECFPLDMHY